MAPTAQCLTEISVLTENQTTSFLTSDLDPGTTGYIVAIATDLTGCPVSHNFLIGDEFIKTVVGGTTFFGSLGAEAISALYDGYNLVAIRTP
jgi:hypothetical protein